MLYSAFGKTPLSSTGRTLPENLSWRRLTSDSAVLVGTTIAINLLRIVNTVVLTRLLSPSDFGLIGIVISIFFVINMITDAGFQPYIVRHERGLEPHFLNAIWTIHFTRGIINTLIAAFVSLPLSFVLGKPQLAPLLAVASLTLAIDGSASLSLMTALRQKLVRRLSVVDFYVFMAQLFFGLFAAWMFRSVWAIVCSMFFASITRVLSSYLIFPESRRRLVYDRPISRELWQFSRLIAVSSTLTLVISQIDKLVLARILSLMQFGIYSVSANLASAPTALVNMYSSRSTYPALSNAWRNNPCDLRRKYYSMRGIVFYSYIFSAGALIGASTIIVHILYDRRYQGSAFYLRMLAITTAMTMLTKQMNDLMVVAGRVRVTLETNVVRVAWLVVAAAVGLATLGSLGLILALALIEIPAYLYEAWRLSRHGLYDFRREAISFGVILGGITAGWCATVISGCWMKLG